MISSIRKTLHVTDTLITAYFRRHGMRMLYMDFDDDGDSRRSTIGRPKKNLYCLCGQNTSVAIRDTIRRT